MMPSLPSTDRAQESADGHRIVHIASMARSGETLLLRTLAAHPRIHIVHNLLRHDTQQDLHSADRSADFVQASCLHVDHW